MKIKDIIAVCFALLLLYSCGSKKKITSFQKSYEIESMQKNAEVKDSAKVVLTDTTKKKSSNSEEYQKTTTETATFDKDGKLVSYTKQTNEKGSKKSDNEENAGLSKDSTAVYVASSVSDSTNTKKSEEKALDLTKTAKNPIWNWIGIGLFVLILGAGVVLYFKKFR